jgi:hypothetical protein
LELNRPNDRAKLLSLRSRIEGFIEMWLRSEIEG